MRGVISINKGFAQLLVSLKPVCQVASSAFSTTSGDANSSSKGAVVSEIKQKSSRIDRLNFTPHEYWITQGKGMERPFTGDKWFEKDVGYYHCTVCESRLFTWDHKFQSPTGMATFWHHERNAVTASHAPARDVLESTVNVEVTINDPSAPTATGEKKHATCTKCQSHLGLVHFDGPPPTFKRYTINSAALKFIKKEHWENPHFIHTKRHQKAISQQEEQARKRSVLNAQQVREKEFASSSSSSSSSSSASD